MSRVYLDDAAATPLSPVVLEFLQEHLEVFGNPSSQHREGRRARALVDEARERVAAVLGVTPLEVVFTSGATESLNMAMRGFTGVQNGLVTSAIEHSAVLNTANDLAAFKQTPLRVLPVSPEGWIPSEAVPEGAGLAVFQWVNQETGTVQDLPVLAGACEAKGLPLLVDAAQAGYQDLAQLGRLPVAMAALSPHKMYGPKGVGVLMVRSFHKIRPLLTGGSQENAFRAGTENPALIGAAALAIEETQKNREKTAQKIKKMRDDFFVTVKTRMPSVILHGPPIDHPLRSPGHLNLSFPGVSGEGLVLNLDMEGVAASTGSACTSGSVKPSHVLEALGVSKEENLAAVRFSLGRSLTLEDIRTATDLLFVALEHLSKNQHDR